MKPQENNFAYIDGANLHNAIKELGFDVKDIKEAKLYA